jgi:hypothetical protein
MPEEREKKRARNKRGNTRDSTSLAALIGVFCIGKNRVVKIVRSSSEVVLRTIKHTVIYLGSGPSLEVIALHPTT